MNINFYCGCKENVVLKKLDTIIDTLFLILRKEETIMAAIDDLKAQVKSLQDEVTTISDSVTSEIARVEAVIAALQSGGVSDADIAQAAKDLGSVVENLKSAGTMLDSERPTTTP